MMGTSTLNLFIPGYVTDHGFSLEQASLTAAAVMAGVTVGKLVLGWVNDRNCMAGVVVTTACGMGGLAVLLAGAGALASIMGGASFSDGPMPESRCRLRCSQGVCSALATMREYIR